MSSMFLKRKLRALPLLISVYRTLSPLYFVYVSCQTKVNTIYVAYIYITFKKNIIAIENRTGILTSNQESVADSLRMVQPDSTYNQTARVHNIRVNITTFGQEIPLFPLVP